MLTVSDDRLEGWSGLVLELVSLEKVENKGKREGEPR